MSLHSTPEMGAGVSLIRLEDKSCSQGDLSSNLSSASPVLFLAAQGRMHFLILIPLFAMVMEILMSCKSVRNLPVLLEHQNFPVTAVATTSILCIWYHPTGTVLPLPIPP